MHKYRIRIKKQMSGSDLRTLLIRELGTQLNEYRWIFNHSLSYLVNTGIMAYAEIYCSEEAMLAFKLKHDCKIEKIS